MAKTKPKLPATTELDESADTEPVTEKPAKSKTTKPQPWKKPGDLKPMAGVVQIKVPIAITGDFVPRRIRTDVRNITDKQRLGLNLLMEGLKCDGGELESGQHVNNHVNALRFVLEQIAEAAQREF
jgi:hypothetical protein